LGIRRLYFVSRDGQILFEIAKRLNAKRNTDLELKYLYGSRQAWHFAALKEFGPREFHWLLMNGPCFSIRNLLGRLRITPEEIRETLERAAFPKTKWDANLSTDGIKRMREVVLEPHVAAIALQRARDERTAALRYLAQEGLCDGTPSAIVDVGWLGELHESLCRILQDSNIRRNPPGMFFGLRPNHLDINPQGKSAYFFDGRQSTEHGTALPEMAVLLEMFCSADHGLVVGYREADGRMSPLLKSPKNDLLLEWGLKQVTSTVLRVCDHLVNAPPRETGSDLRPVCLDLLRSFWEKPTRKECAAWGAYPFETDQTGIEYRRLARALTWRDVLLIPRRESPFPQGICWKQGCLMLTNSPTAFVLNTLRMTRRSISFLRKLATGDRKASSAAAAIVGLLRRIIPRQVS
jgi:hypothetical protein